MVLLNTVKEMEPKKLEPETLITVTKIKEGFELHYLTGLEGHLGLNSNEALTYSMLYSLSKWVNNKHKMVDADGNIWVKGQTGFILSQLGWTLGKEKTLRRSLKALEDLGLIVSQQVQSYDRAKWYHIVSITTLC
ncbi:hypothetical protein ACRXCV_00540 (plasmid) [Halobacteriovorax sp. GFR7]|uniref:hypothetical protein n=1 Tax=unclassified Halobacteriovorax TaxID=2639665 RepID=UPI003D97F3FC